MENNENQGYQPFQQYQQEPPRPFVPEPHRGTLILVFGIVGLVACAVFGVLAWIFANEDLRKMAGGTMDPAGRDLTNTGRVLGIISVIMNAIGILFGIIYFVFIAGAMGAAASQGLNFMN